MTTARNPTRKMQFSGARPCTKSPNTLLGREESRTPLDLHNRVGQTPSTALSAKIFSSSGSVCAARRLSAPAARRWPLPSDPWNTSAHLRLRASLPELADGRVPVVGHPEPAHPIGGGTFQVRAEATKLGHSFPSSTGFGRRRASAGLCDCQD